MVERTDIKLPAAAPLQLHRAAHADYLVSWHSSTHSYEYTLTEYLRLSGIYWCATALDLLAARERLPRDGVLAFVRSCYVPRLGGYACSPGNPPHLLYTLSGVQLLAEYGEMPDAAQADAIADYVARLQQDDGSFAGENSPSSAGCLEVDTRFSLCALACLKLLRRLHVIRLNDAVEYILRCMNFDGGFGVGPNSETHAGQIFCCVGALAIAGESHRVDADLLGWWLAERQLESGGFNGRPEKLPDVCYSWWVLSALTVLDRLHWIDHAKLRKFILACQDDETGGFADRPGDVVDPFHTHFGLAGLSLLGEPGLKPINPIFCMPQETVDRVLGNDQPSFARV